MGMINRLLSQKHEGCMVIAIVVLLLAGLQIASPILSVFCFLTALSMLPLLSQMLQDAPRTIEVSTQVDKEDLACLSINQDDLKQDKFKIVPVESIHVGTSSTMVSTNAL